jgi:hypothetical protein
LIPGRRIERDDVKAGFERAVTRMPAEKQGRGSRKFTLFIDIHRRGRRGEAAACPVPDFDEYQAIVVSHHEVDLANSATIVSLYLDQAVLQKVQERQLLPPITDGGAARTHQPGRSQFCDPESGKSNW